MNKISKAWSFGFGGAAVLILSGAAAQPEDFLYQLNYGSLEPAALDGAQPNQGTLSPEQMLSESNSHVREMEQGAAALRGQRMGAREQHDVVKVLCLDDKLSQIVAIVRSAQARAEKLRTALVRNDKVGSGHELTLLRGLSDRIRTLVAASNQCIGEDIGVVGETKVTVNVDPSLAEEEPSEFPAAMAPNDPEMMLSAPPVVSSPTQ